MDLESLGGGGLGGFITAILTLLGWNRRISHLEKEKQDASVCEKIHTSVDENYKNMRSDLVYIRDRLDKLYDIEMEKRRNAK